MLLQTKSLVLAGAWNVAILSPDWIVRQILGQDKADVRVAIQMPLTFPVRASIAIGSVSYLIQSDRVELTPRSSSEAALAEVEGIAARLLSKLPYTPLGGVGFNFVFRATDVPPRMLRTFDVANEFAVALEQEPEIIKTEIEKVVQIENCHIKITQSLTGPDEYVINFNYHILTNDAQAAATVLDGTQFAKKKGLTFTLLQEVLGYSASSIEEEERENN